MTTVRLLFVFVLPFAVLVASPSATAGPRSKVERSTGYQRAAAYFRADREMRVRLKKSKSGQARQPASKKKRGPRKVVLGKARYLAKQKAKKTKKAGQKLKRKKAKRVKKASRSRRRT